LQRQRGGRAVGARRPRRGGTRPRQHRQRGRDLERRHLHDPLPGLAERRAGGYATPETNQVQVLTVDATGGSYVLSFHDTNGALYTTAPIPYNANAEQLRQAIQNAIAIGQTIDPNIRLYLAAKVDMMVDRYPAGNWDSGKNLD